MQEISSKNIASLVTEAFQLREKRENSKALAIAEACLKQFPRDPRVLALMGVLLFDQKKISAAIKHFHTAIALQPDDPENYFILGQILKATGRTVDAINALEECLKLKPNHLEALYHLGVLYEKSKKWRSAERKFKEIIENDPNNARAYYNLGITYHVQNKLQDAIEAYEKSLELKNDIDTLGNIGAAYTKDRQFEKAIDAYEQALKLNPEAAIPMTNLGGTYIEMGNLKQGEFYLRKALMLQPKSASRWRNLTLCCEYDSEDNSDLTTIINNLNEKKLSDEEKIHYYFALGNIYDSLKNYERAFYYYDFANQLQRKYVEFKPKVFLNHVQKIIRTFKELPKFSFSFEQNSGVQPVFIVGAPRSGKSLLEKILSTHPLIAASGEVGIAEVANALPEDKKPKGNYPFWVPTLTKKEAKDLKEIYYKRLIRDVHKPKCVYAIDTMPGNFLFFGLLHLFFPKAKFIVCQRDPLDVGICIYFKYFVDGHGYSYDLKKIGEFYQQYQKMISFWKEQYPELIHEVRYEDMINHPQETMKGVLTYLNLDNVKFDFTILKKDELRYAQHYDEYLAPLKEGLAEKIDDDANAVMPDEKNKMSEAYHLFENGKLADAKRIALSVAKERKNDYSPYHLLALIEEQLNNTEDAAKYYKIAIKKVPTVAQVHLDLSALYNKMGKKMLSEKHLKEAENLKNAQAKFKKEPLTQKQKQILLAPFSSAPSFLAEDGARVLYEGRLKEDERSQSFMTRSWDQYFTDLSRGSYRTVQEEGKYAWRMRAWHFLFKNLALIETMLSDPKPVLYILDIGCASGFLRRFLEGNVDPNKSQKIYYWGIDIRKDVLERAVFGINDIESGAAGNLVPSLFLHHDIQFGLPFKNRSFDYVVNFEVIKYLPIEQGKALLKEINRVLASTGLFYLSTSYQPDKPGYMQSVPFEVIETMLRESEFSLRKRRGSQASILSLASQIKPSHEALVKELLTVHPPEIVGAMITPLYPHLADQVTFVCTKSKG